MDPVPTVEKLRAAMAVFGVVCRVDEMVGITLRETLSTFDHHVLNAVSTCLATNVDCWAISLACALFLNLNCCRLL